MYGLADPPVALAAWMLNQPRTMAPRLMAASRARSDQPGEVGRIGHGRRRAPGGTAPAVPHLPRRGRRTHAAN